MNVDPQIVSSLLVATGAAALYVVGAKLARIAGSAIRLPTPYSRLLAPEPGERYRRTLERIDARLNTLIAALAVLVCVYLSLSVMVIEPWWSELAAWSWWLLALFLAALGVYGTARIVSLVRQRLAARHHLEAQLAVAQRLKHVAAHGNTLFHQVPAGNGAIDHVALGSNGVYAVHVVVRRPRKEGAALLRGDRLEFLPGEEVYDLEPWVHRVAALRARLQQALGHRVRVMSVIVAPGWESLRNEGEKHLLVNHSNLTMLVGWRDPEAYLMDSELETVHELLAAGAA